MPVLHPEVLNASGLMALLLGIFVLISHITLLNMLVGVRTGTPSVTPLARCRERKRCGRTWQRIISGLDEF